MTRFISFAIELLMKVEYLLLERHTEFCLDQGIKIYIFKHIIKLMNNNKTTFAA